LSVEDIATGECVLLGKLMEFKNWSDVRSLRRLFTFFFLYFSILDLGLCKPVLYHLRVRPVLLKVVYDFNIFFLKLYL